MGLFEVLFGWNKQPRTQTDPLFALSTAAISMETELGWLSRGKAGICLKPAATADFRAVEKDLQDLLSLAVRETQTEMKLHKDDYHYLWLIFTDPDWDDLVSLIHMTGTTLKEQGYGSQLLAAVFSLRQETRPRDTLYLVYNYKRGNFYPFLPASGKQERDSAEEMKAYALMEKELPWEKDMAYWYPLWGCPV